MKKIFTILALTLALTAVSFSAKTDTKKVFTFEGHQVESTDVFSIQEKNITENSNYIAYPYFTGDSNSAAYAAAINKTVTKFADSLNSKNKKVDASYKITGSNAKFVSILFSIRETDSKTYVSTSYYKALTFDATNGKQLILKDLLQPGYETGLKEVINDKIKQLGIPTTPKFKGVDKNQQFYLEDSSIVFFYQPNTATTFADGELFLPFILTDLIGLIK
ncbi:MAG: DUF3298 domain-containing protein [Leptotrichiaceae bacterium]|jgi:hypothetical protein